MQQNVNHQLIIGLNNSIESISSGRVHFRSNSSITTIVNRNQPDAIVVRADGTGQVTLTSAGHSYYVSIGINNGVGVHGLIIANIRVNAFKSEIKFNDNWVLSQDGLRNERLNQSTRRVPLNYSPNLHILYRADAFNFVGGGNFLNVRSSYGFRDSPVALHLMHNGLLDVIWHPARSINAYSEYIHELYYFQYPTHERP